MLKIVKYAWENSDVSSSVQDFHRLHFEIVTSAAASTPKEVRAYPQRGSGPVNQAHLERGLRLDLLIGHPSMHHGTCATYVPWCMSVSLTGGGWKIVPGIPGACATRNFTYLTRGLCELMKTQFTYTCMWHKNEFNRKDLLTLDHIVTSNVPFGHGTFLIWFQLIEDEMVCHHQISALE